MSQKCIPYDVKKEAGKLSASFSFNPSKYLNPSICRNPNVKVSSKINGTISQDGTPFSFISDVLFTISLDDTGLNAKISDISLTDITIISKYTTPPTSCGNFTLYYNVNKPDETDTSNIIDGSQDLVVFEILKDAFLNMQFDFTPDLLTCAILFDTTANPGLTFMEGGVLLNSTDLSNPCFNKYSLTGCSGGRLPIIRRLIRLLIQILIIILIISIIDPCCKMFPVFCSLRKLLTPAILNRITGNL